jgi:hypothetical protein
MIMLKYCSTCLFIIFLVSCKHDEAPVKPKNDSALTLSDTVVQHKVVVKRDSADSANTAYDGRPDPSPWNRIPGTPMHINMLADYGHLARTRAMPVQGALQFKFTFTTDLLERILRLPSEDHPPDLLSAFKVWMAETPPRVGIPPTLVIGTEHRLIRHDRYHALFELWRGDVLMGTVTFTKFRVKQDSLWVVTEATRSAPENPNQ